MAKIDAFFKYMIEQGASDLHLAAGAKAKIRKHGELEEMSYPELTNEALQSLLFEITTEDQKKAFLARRDLDFAYEIPGLARFRANYFEQKRGSGAVFNSFLTTIPLSAWGRKVRWCCVIITGKERARRAGSKPR